MECKLYSELYGVDTVSLRYFNVYSEDQEVNGPYSTAIANWMETIKNNEDPFITGDGKQRRDMVHVSDVVSANIFAMECCDDFKGQNYDVGTGENISLNEVKQIVQYFPGVIFNYVGERKGDVALTKADINPLEKLGWRAKISIKEGINNCFERLKNEN